MAHIPQMTFAAGALVALTAAATAQVQYDEITSDLGIEPHRAPPGMGAGAAAADYDDDGDVDIFLPTAAGIPDRLYRNGGDGTFDEVAAAVGLASMKRSRVGLWLDYDGDRRLDLLVLSDCFLLNQNCFDADDTVHFYRQRDDGTFEDVTAAAGLGGDTLTHGLQHRGGAAAGDLNNDGYVDLIFGTWKGVMRVFLNMRAGSFAEISPGCGIGDIEEGHWQPMMHDFNGDGWLDIFAAIDFEPNHLWMNRGNGTFEDAGAVSGAGVAWNDMGVGLGDYDNDGDIDIYVSEIYEDGRHSILLRNDSTDDGLVFEEISEKAGVDHTWWGWGVTFMDADMDGRLDIGVTNGFFSEPWASDPTRLYRNLGNDSFEDIAGAVGMADSNWGSALLSFDFDRDGDLDVFQTCNNGSGPLRVLRHTPVGPPAKHHWLVVKPRMGGANHRALGAVVRVTTASRVMTRVITAGTSYLGQEPAEAHFGLGDDARVECVRVEWPGGGRTVMQDVAVDQLVTIEPAACGGADLDGDGGVGFVDLVTMLGDWGACACCPADLDDSGSVGFDDLTALLAAWGVCP